jgi:ABC-type transport system substrate-binding protein
LKNAKRIYATLFAALMLVGLSSPFSPLAFLTPASAAGTTARLDPVLNITLIVPPNNPTRIAYGQMVVTGLQNLGINASLKVIPWGQYFDRCLYPNSTTQGKTYADGGFDFNCVGYGMGPDPDPYQMYHSSEFASNTGVGGNYYLWANTINDYLCNEIHHETNQTKLTQELQQWQALVYDEIPSVALYYLKDIVPIAKNLNPTPFTTNFYPNWPGVEAWSYTSSPLTSVTLAQYTPCGIYGLSPASGYTDALQVSGYGPIFGEMGGFGLLSRGPAPTWAVQPYMAYGNYTHSADCKSWTFWIRPGIKFQNEEELDARDVVYTFRYAMTPDWGSLNHDYFAQILGSNTSVYWAGEQGTLGAGEPLNYYKVHFNLPETYAYFMQKICTTSIMPASVIVNNSHGIPSYLNWHPEQNLTNIRNFVPYSPYNTGPGSAYNTGSGTCKYYGKNGTLLAASGPFGAGPYKFVSYNSVTGSLHLTKFMGYFNRAALEGAGEYKIVDYNVTYIGPEVDKLITPSNVSVAISALKAGTVQVLDPNYRFENYMGNLSSSFCQWAVHNGFIAQELGFNMQHPIFGTGLGTPVGMADVTKAAEAAKHMRRGIEYLFLKDSILKNMTNGYATYGVTSVVTRATSYFNDQIMLRNDTTLNQRLLAIKEFEAAGYHLFVDLTLLSGTYALTPSWCFKQYGFSIQTDGASGVNVKFFSLPPPGTGSPPAGKLAIVYLDIHGVKLVGSNETVLYIYYNVTRCQQLGVDENTLAINIWNSTPTGHWSALPSTHLELNSTHGLLFAVAPHFSYFGVFGTSAQGGGQPGGAGTTVVIVIAAVAVVVVAGITVLLKRRGNIGKKRS